MGIYREKRSDDWYCSPIGAYDVLLAGQARRRSATLVTSKAKEFARVTALKWEDWAASRR